VSADTAAGLDAAPSGAVAAAFAGVDPVDAPVVTILVGGPGAAPARAVRRLLASSPFPTAYVNRSDLLALDGGSRRGGREDLLEEALDRARQSKLPLIIDDDAISASPNETLAAFKSAGFTTRIVVTVPRETEAAVTIATQRLQQQLASTGAQAERGSATSWKDIVETLRAIPRESVDRVLVLDGDGESAYDGPPRAAAWNAVGAALRAPLRGSQGVLWLGELRRVTDYIANSGAPVTRADCESVLSLYDLAQRRVLPELPIRDDSRSAVMQREVLRAGRAAIERTVQRIAQTSVDPEITAPTPRSPGL
jgi:hypothetical protein